MRTPSLSNSDPSFLWLTVATLRDRRRRQPGRHPRRDEEAASVRPSLLSLFLRYRHGSSPSSSRAFQPVGSGRDLRMDSLVGNGFLDASRGERSWFPAHPLAPRSRRCLKVPKLIRNSPKYVCFPFILSRGFFFAADRAFCIHQSLLVPDFSSIPPILRRRSGDRKSFIRRSPSGKISFTNNWRSLFDDGGSLRSWKERGFATF